MRVIITGGSGLIGQALAKDFIKDGYEVIILSRSPGKMKGLLPEAEFVQWDGRTLGDWAAYFEGAQAVINLAGASIAGEHPLKMRWTPDRKKAISESRAKSGKAVSEAFNQSRHKPGVLVQSSAVGFYGPLGDERVDENFPNGEDYLSYVCREWENSTQSVEALGTRRVIVRTGLVYNREAGIFPLLKLPFSLFIGGKLGTGQQHISWVHIDDVVGAIRFLIDHQQAKGTFNLTAPHPLTNLEFSKTLGTAMKRPSIFPVPSFVMKLALGEVSTLALDGQRVIPTRLLEEGYSFKYAHFEAALEELLQPGFRFMHTFKVKASKVAVAAFHRDTSVLRKLTPFPIIVQFKHVEPVGEGTKAIFTLWFGPIPVPWVAKHHDFDPPDGFYDTQLKGPFTSWVHRHSFIDMGGGETAVVDEIYAQYGKGLFPGLVSRFMGLTLPILFAFRSWRTRHILEKV